jgi:D-3-phosphoglycerate dehydrogenase
MKVVVSAVAFSKNEQLVNKLKEYFPNAVVNAAGKRFLFEELVDYYADADAIIIGLEKIDDALLQRLTKLKFIAKYGVGLDNIDLDACKRRSIGIGWTGGVNRYSVAEMALGMMIMLSRNLYATSNQLKAGTWNKNGGRSLSECTIGIIGMGFIGKQLVEMLAPFTQNILLNDLLDLSDFIKGTKLKQVPKDQLFASSDIISIHTPLTDETRNMINADTIEMMKPSVQIINTARGGIVNENDLVHALRTQRIAGAALDVFATEPPNSAFFADIPNLIMTPHIGGNSHEAVLNMGYSAINHIYNFKFKT